MKLCFENKTDKIIENNIFEKLSGANNIILFGAGRSGDYFYNFLSRNQIRISCFCDNYAAKQNKYRNGVEVYSFETAIHNFPDAYICITSVYQNEIYEQIAAYNPALLKRTIKVQGGMNWETVDKKYQSNESEYVKTHLDGFLLSYNLLEDDKSKKVFENLLNYRISRKPNYLEEIAEQNTTYFDTEIFGESIKKNISVFLDGGV